MSTFDYDTLSESERLAIVTGRLKELEADHYGNTLMRKSIEQATDVAESDKAAMLQGVDEKLHTLERAISVHRAERDRYATSGAD